MDTHTLVERINAWIAAGRGATQLIAERQGVSPAIIDVQRAAMVALDLEDTVSLLDREWTAESLAELIGHIEFKAWGEYEEIVLEESVIPDGVPRRLDEETIKFHGEKWRIHRYDPDDFPCLPHAHNLYDGIKMDLRNGRLYRRRELVGQLPKKRLLMFRQRVRLTPLPELET